MQVCWFISFLTTQKKKTICPDNTAWVGRFPPKTSAVVTPTLSTPIRLQNLLNLLNGNTRNIKNGREYQLI
jgi:hypothetical protein